MSETRVKIQSIVENQLPDFIAEENPLLVDFRALSEHHKPSTARL